MSILFQDPLKGKKGPPGKDAGNQIIPYMGRIAMNAAAATTLEVYFNLGFGNCNSEEYTEYNAICFVAPLDLRLVSFTAAFNITAVNSNPEVEILILISPDIPEVTDIAFKFDPITLTSTGLVEYPTITPNYLVPAGYHIAVCIHKLSSGVANRFTGFFNGGMEILPN